MSNVVKAAGFLMLVLALAGFILAKGPGAHLYHAWVIGVVKDVCLLLGLAGAAALALGFNWHPIKVRLPAIKIFPDNFFPKQ